MLDETQYYAIANATLDHCHDQLEDAYERGELEELELNDGVLTIQTSDGKTFVLSRHAPSHQVWLASPFSGGLHFSYSTADKRWVDSAGRALYDTLSGDLKRAGVTVTL